MFDKFKLFIVLKTSAASIIFTNDLKAIWIQLPHPPPTLDELKEVPLVLRERGSVGIGDKLLKRLLPCKIEGFHDGV